jgi:hypothetical protein
MKTIVATALALALSSSAFATDLAPFPTTQAQWADAHGLVGKSCTHMFSNRGQDFPGYATPKGFVTVTLGNDGWIFPMEKGGARFAFLITGLGDNACKTADVVALPDAAHANAWFQCHARETLTEGFGLRLSGHKDIVGWWTVDAGKLKRLPDDGKVICQQPETGD